LIEKNGSLRCDVGLIGGIVPESVSPEGLRRDVIGELVEVGGILALKSFMIDSGAAEFSHVTLEQLEAAMFRVAALQLTKHNSLGDLPYMLHAEMPPLEEPSSTASGKDTKYEVYEATRPEIVEVRAVQAALLLSQRTNCSVHVCHVASARAADVIRAAHALGVHVSAETCPHYLLYSFNSNVPNGTNTTAHYKCAPPIRSENNRKLLWHAVLFNEREQSTSNLTWIVSSDHSPSPNELKLGGLLQAWGGISGLQFRLPATWTPGRDEGLDLVKLSALLATEPARRVGLGRRKGAIVEGMDADLVFWDPEECADTSVAASFATQNVSPMLEQALAGRVYATLVAGIVSFIDGDSGLTSVLDEDGASIGRMLVRKTQPETGEDFNVSVARISAKEQKKRVAEHIRIKKADPATCAAHVATASTDKYNS